MTPEEKEVLFNALTTILYNQRNLCRHLGVELDAETLDAITACSKMDMENYEKAIALALNE